MLDYLATKPDAMIIIHASEITLNIHYDASFLSAKIAKSRASVHLFLVSVPKDGELITLNDEIFILCIILKFVELSASESELGALFVNVKEGHNIRLTLAGLTHSQPPTPTNCDNDTAAGIYNSTIKKQRSHSMEMRSFYFYEHLNTKTI